MSDEVERLTIIASELQDLCDRQAKRLAEVEKDAMPLYSEAQVKELLAERDAVLKQALDALYWTTPIGGKPVKQTQDAMDAIRKVLA